MKLCNNKEQRPTPKNAVVPSVNGLARAIEHAAKHVPGHRCLQHLHLHQREFTSHAATSRKQDNREQTQTTMFPRRQRTSPVNSRVVWVLSMPEVPSNTCTTALLPSTSRTWPRRAEPSPSRMLTISAYFGFCNRNDRLKNETHGIIGRDGPPSAQPSWGMDALVDPSPAPSPGSRPPAGPQRLPQCGILQNTNKNK